MRLTSHANIIPMRLDAAFFYQRGVRFLERNDLKRAVKAFRKTVEYEPENPVNYCNLAGVLSEMGDFEASNNLLLHVLRELDPGMTECQFYLANNYANMGDYETAEEYVIRYLDNSPDGEFADDAEDMLSVLMEEFGGGKVFQAWEEKRKESERESAKRDGRHLLEEGQFEAAVEWLERAVSRDSDNMAARNNLSLAYYYTGQYESAIAQTEEVLEQEPFNIHALCNMAVFTAQLGPRERLQACVARLEKVFPLHYDQAMKVGTTLGLIGHHEKALFVFERLARVVENPEPVLYHSIAAAAANTGRFHLARKWWKVLIQTPELVDVATYYLDLLDQTIDQGKRSLRVSYQYDLPLHVQFTKMKERLRTGDLENWRRDPLLRASLYWGLRHGTRETRQTVLRTLALLADEDAERALRLFIKRPDIDISLQSAALFALQRTGARGRVEYYRDGELRSIRMSDLPKDMILSIDPAWQTVWIQTEDWLRDHVRGRYTNEAKRTWVAFVKHAFLRANLRITKPEVWVAGLLYTTLKQSGKAVRQREIADMFQVSVSSLSKAAVRLQAFMGRD